VEILQWNTFVQLICTKNGKNKWNKKKKKKVF
jgi:hypothetical protein